MQRPEHPSGLQPSLEPFLEPNASPLWQSISVAELPIRADLQSQLPYGAPQLDVPVQLNVNENPYPPSARLIAAVVEAVTVATAHANRYPDRDFDALRQDLAAYLTDDSGVTLDASRIWAANGSNEVLMQLLQLFGGPGRTALAFTPTYAMYEEYCRTTLTPLHALPRLPDFTLDTIAACEYIQAVQPNVIFLTSPNNPTGTALDLDVIETILKVAPGIVIVDEAYGEFRRDGVASAISLLPQYPKMVVCRTMSKAFSFAGVRLGYCACAPAVAEALKLVRLPYHLSAITQATARAALASRQELLSQVSALRRERDATVAWLRANGFDAADSDANFVLFGRFEDRRRVWQGLLDRGVLIRESGPSPYLRVSIGTPVEMAAFREALLAVMAGIAAR